jgi:hypothetical protein
MPFARKALLAFGVVVLFAVAAAAEGGGSVCFDRMFSFGDSLTDTGNFLLSVPEDFPDPARHLPYGQTFFGRPSGRYSDGRNLLDFFGNLPTLSVFSPSFSGVIICSLFVFLRLSRVLSGPSPHCLKDGTRLRFLGSGAKSKTNAPWIEERRTAYPLFATPRS